MPNGKTIKERLIALEVKMDAMLNNHFPHLEDKVDRIQWLLVTTLISVCVSFIGIIATLLFKFT